MLLIVVPDLPPPAPELVEKPPPIIPDTTPATTSTVKATTGIRQVLFVLGRITYRLKYDFFHISLVFLGSPPYRPNRKPRANMVEGG